MMNRKAQVINLWRTCFGDPESFISLFFDHIYKEEQTLTLEKEGQVVSALQVLPYELCYYGTTLPVGYLCGVSTLPAEQGKGYMRQLMEQTLPYLRQKGFVLSFLIPAEPWLFDYYASMGYASAFGYSMTSYSEEIYKGAETNGYTLCEELVDSPSFPALHTYIYRHLGLRPIGLLHTAADLRINLIDYAQSGGGVFTLRDNRQQIQAAAFALPQSAVANDAARELLVKECFVEKESLRPLLFKLLMAHFQVKQVWLKGPTSETSLSHPMGMAHLIDPASLCRIWQAHHPGKYTLEELLALPSKELTQKLFNMSECPPYLSLMLD